MTPKRDFQSTLLANDIVLTVFKKNIIKQVALLSKETSEITYYEQILEVLKFDFRENGEKVRLFQMYLKEIKRSFFFLNTSEEGRGKTFLKQQFLNSFPFNGH